MIIFLSIFLVVAVVIGLILLIAFASGGGGDEYYPYCIGCFVGVFIGALSCGLLWRILPTWEVL